MTNRRIARIGAALCAALLLVWSTTATGATEEELFDRLTDEEEARVIELLDEGEEAYDAGDYDRAAARFHEVHNLFPHPSVSYRLAECYERLGDNERAIQYYNHFLEREPDAAERDEVEAAIDDLEAAIDDISFIRVESIPIGADIYIGSRETVPVGETPDPVTLEPGTHEIIVDKAGYHSEQRTVTVDQGDDRIIQFDMQQDTSDGGQRTSSPDRSAGTSDIEWWQPVVTVGLVGFGGLMTYQAVRTDDSSMRRTMGIGAGAMFLGAGAFTVWWATRDSGSGLSMGISPDGDAVQVGLQGRF